MQQSSKRAFWFTILIIPFFILVALFQKSCRRGDRENRGIVACLEPRARAPRLELFGEDGSELFLALEPDENGKLCAAISLAEIPMLVRTRFQADVPNGTRLLLAPFSSPQYPTGVPLIFQKGETEPILFTAREQPMVINIDELFQSMHNESKRKGDSQ